MRTYVVLEFYCLFFPNILGCWRPKFSNFFNSFHNRVEFGTIFLEGLRNFGEGGRFEHPKPLPGYATGVACQVSRATCDICLSP